MEPKLLRLGVTPWGEITPKSVASMKGTRTRSRAALIRTFLGRQCRFWFTPCLCLMLLRTRREGAEVLRLPRKHLPVPVLVVDPRPVWYQNPRYQNLRYQNLRFQNLRYQNLRHSRSSAIRLLAGERVSRYRNCYRTAFC